MTLDRAVASAKSLVSQQFPQAGAAWLGGSVAAGRATPGSDLDITVLIDGPPAPYRDSLHHQGWPVELFVHTERSLQEYVDREVKAGKPTLLRLVSASVILLDRDGAAARWQGEFGALLSDGPLPHADDLNASRYRVTDILDDLRHARSTHEAAITASVLAVESALLVLKASGHWWGLGKWLARELEDLDERTGSTWATRHRDALIALPVDSGPLIEFAEQTLDLAGGPLFDGYRVAGQVSEITPDTARTAAQ